MLAAVSARFAAAAPTDNVSSATARKSSLQLSIAGGVAGLAEALSVQPFDFLKTRFHLSRTPNPSILAGLRAVYHEGGFLRFYRGVLPELVGMIPKSSLMYMSYEESRRIFVAHNEGVMTSSVAFVAGLVSGVFEATAVAPFQVVKIRLMAKSYLGRYRNSLDCVRSIVRDEGAARLMRGYGPTLWRNCVWNSVYFALMFRVKDWLPATSSRSADLLQTLLSGFVGGLVATGFNAPFDMVKSRFQEELLVGNAKPHHRWTLVTLLDVFRTEGPRACYKGFAPKAVRMGLGGAVAMGAFELSCAMMRDDEHS